MATKAIQLETAEQPEIYTFLRRMERQAKQHPGEQVTRLFWFTPEPGIIYRKTVQVVANRDNPNQLRYRLLPGNEEEVASVTDVKIVVQRLEKELKP